MNMKKNYENPELEIVILDSENVIKTSEGTDLGKDENGLNVYW